MLAGNWFGFCHPNIPAWNECQSLLKQMNAGQPVPPNNTPAASHSTSGNGPQSASGDAPGIFRLDRNSYPPMALAHVTWSNFPATATIRVWFSPVGSAPKTEIGKGLFFNSPYWSVTNETKGNRGQRENAGG